MAFSSEVAAGSREENASKEKAGARFLIQLEPGSSGIALCAGRRYIRQSNMNRAAWPRIRDTMRAEVERLVEEIKQSVGLLRRHL